MKTNEEIQQEAADRAECKLFLRAVFTFISQCGTAWRGGPNGPTPESMAEASGDLIYDATVALVDKKN